MKAKRPIPMATASAVKAAATATGAEIAGMECLGSMVRVCLDSIILENE